MAAAGIKDSTSKGQDHIQRYREIREACLVQSWRFQDRDSLSFRDSVALGDKQLGDFPFRGRHHRDLHLHDLDEYDRLVASNVLSFAALDSANNTRSLGFYAYFGHRRPLWRG